jgi:hypothetical protein
MPRPGLIPLAAEPLLAAVGDIAARKLKRPNLTAELRYPAYRDFRGAALRSVLSLDLWTASRPGIVGAVWSWPDALRSYRNYLTNMQEMVVQFGEVVCVSRRPSFDPVSFRGQRRRQGAVQLLVGEDVGGCTSTLTPCRCQSGQASMTTSRN